MSPAAIGIERTPLESWIAERLAVSASALTRADFQAVLNCALN